MNWRQHNLHSGKRLGKAGAPPVETPIALQALGVSTPILL